MCYALCDTRSKQVDRYKDWAIRLSEALDNFIWLHSGGNGNINIVYRNSLNLVCSFRKDLGVQDRLGLKACGSHLKQVVETACLEESCDPVLDDTPEAIIRAVADYIEHLDLGDDCCSGCKKRICEQLRSQAD